MTFLTLNDFESKLDPEIRNQITGQDDTLFDDAEAQAIGLIKDALADRYDIDSELAKIGTDRHVNMMRWLMNLSLYFIYERIPAQQVPERIVKNYDDTVHEIELIERGKRATQLTKVVDIVTNQPKRIFRWGSSPKRIN
jgi:hypothetical protein